MRKNLPWFEEIERKLSKLSMTTFYFHSSSYLFYAPTPPPLTTGTPTPIHTPAS
jgi:hypothetical protein